MELGPSPIDRGVDMIGCVRVYDELARIYKDVLNETV